MIKNMRVCMISASFLPILGGLQFQVKYLVEELTRKNIDVFLLSYSDGEKFLTKKSNKFPKFIKLKYKSWILGFIELCRIIKKISPHIIHIHSAELNAFQISLLKLFKIIKQPFIITSHGVDIMTYPEIGYGLRLNPKNAFIIRFILRYCARHIIVGESMRKFAIEAGSLPCKIRKINNGIPLIRKEISEEKTKSILKKFEIFPDEYVLLSLSGMRPLKGIEYLLKAMPRILKEFSNVKLILACKGGEYEKYIRNLAESLNIEKNIKFIGFITDEEEKTILIRRSDIFCKPSLLEACSVAILEAIKEGKVVVASIPAGIDILTNNKDGVLVPPRDPNNFAEAVIKILKNKKIRAKIEIFAKETSKKFDIQKTASEYISLYREILNLNQK